MPIKVEIEPEEIVEKTADDRGRITLGADYKNQDVKLLIVSN